MPHHHQVAFFTPLKDISAEAEEGSGSIPKIPINEGPNCLGRSCVPANDKRISRKHLTVIATSGGSAEVFVEGTNPVVIRSKGVRKKLLSGERWEIGDRDVVELIPGHYCFRYTALRNVNSPHSRNKRPLIIEESSSSKEGGHSLKKARENGLEPDSHKTEILVEAIRYFDVPKDKLSQTFRLLRVHELPAWANTNAVSIHDVIQGDVLVAILSNYMVDIDWLLSVCPTLKKIPQVLVIHGEGDSTVEHMKRSNLSNWILHKPALPISYGTHHSKAMILVYPKGVRIVVHTANLIYVDWNNKSQGLWMQDFPWKDQNSSNTECGFERDLIDYLSVLKWPEFNANIPGLGNFNINSSFFKNFDYTRAGVRLIASVPGYHSGPNLKRWGHMKLRTVLQECTFSKEFEKSPLVYQFSSLGSLDEKWMTELATSMSAGMSDDKKPLGLGEQMIIWPTVEDVRCSLEGYAAGSCVPSPLKNVEKPFLKKYWAKWRATHTGRCRAMPHIKTFVRYHGQSVAWLLLTSANLSKAAWGALQKNNSQLMIRSYELGVLFLPSVNCESGFSCTDERSNLSKVKKSTMEKERRAKLVTIAWQGNIDADSPEVTKLPLPYELPPTRYSPEDVPWSWDRRYAKKDIYGQLWPR
ncbi:unnamed protein product [Cuscuta campestris]|uniref:PNK FHA domain-containing protein n=1 Tax=Cuscuta campestris TaxID=132261 RepID=A0A484MIG5_9ASTE|nr:unnamed protein product [Cuscuta campestris]